MPRGNGTARWQVAALAIALDLALGEPATGRHPVVWMGRLVERLERRAPVEGAVRQLGYGAAAEMICLVAAALPAWLLERLFGRGSLLGILVSAVALKPTFAVRALFQATHGVERALEGGNLPAARRAVGQVVSRDVQGLDEPAVCAAAIESLAENASDSVAAPLLFYAAFGLPGAYLYRMANTLDAMWGYRGRYEYLGKTAARVDDLLNLVPSRITALATVATCGMVGGSPGESWRAALRDSSLTASPNAGWPMAAAAGALGVQLEKVGHYLLNARGSRPGLRDLHRARRVVGTGLAAALLGIFLLRR